MDMKQYINEQNFGFTIKFKQTNNNNEFVIVNLDKLHINLGAVYR